MIRYWILTGVAAILLFVGCSSPTSSSSGSPSTSSSTSYTNQVLPTTLAVKTPASFSSSTSSTGKSLARAAAGTGSAGYDEIKTMTTIMKFLVPTTVLYGVVVDAAISQNNLTAGDHTNVTVTLTQAMYNTIAAQLPADETSSAQSAIGSSITLSDVNYSTNGTGTLANSVSITSGSQTITYKWSTDRTKIQMSMVSGTSTITISYDGSDGSGGFKVVDTSYGTFQMTLKPDSTSTKNGASVSMNVTSGSNTFSIYGYADDSGGIVYTSITGTTSLAWEEGFDSTGSLIFQASASTVAGLATATDSYTSTTTTISETTAKASYGTQAAAAATLSSGASSLLA